MREAHYRSSHSARQQSDADARNASIDSYFAAMDRLVGRGYTVVRIGDPSMTPVRRPGVVDLATSPLRTDWVELWCVQQSEFFVASDSGPYFLSRLFRLPSLSVNVVQFLYYVLRPQDRFICKLPVDLRTGGRLSLSEMLTEEYMTMARNPDRYELLDNTAEDIRAAVEEMVGVVNGNLARSTLQDRYDARVAELIERWPHWTRSNWELKKLKKVRGTVSHCFADRYFEASTLSREPVGRR